MRTARVAVVVPLYNNAPYITAAVESIRAQTGVAWHCTVVDDGSVDGAGELIDELVSGDDRFSVIHQENAGACAARNRGLEEGGRQERYVLFLDADDVLLPDALATLAAHLDEHHAAAAVFSDSRIIGADGQELDDGQEQYGARRFHPGRLRLRRVGDEEPRTELGSLLAHMTARPSNTMMRCDAFWRSGAWDPEVFPWDDNDLMARLTLADEVHYLPQMLTGYRLHGSNATLSTFARPAFERYRKKMWNLPGVGPTEQELVRRALVFERYVEARVCVRSATRLARDRQASAAAGEARKAAGALAMSVGMAVNAMGRHRFRANPPVWRLLPQLGFCAENPRSGASGSDARDDLHARQESAA